MLASPMVFGWRADGDEVTNVPLTRRIMPMLMPTRNESVVYFDMDVAADPVDALIESLRADGTHVTMLHIMVAAAARIWQERPRLNRFVTGGRIYQRRGMWVSFSAKKEKSDRGAIVVKKRQIPPEASLREIVSLVEQSVSEGRSDKKTSTDIELSLAFRLPNIAVRAIVAGLKLLDNWGLLPRAVIDNDPMFASIFFANLGSLGMDAARHHLYEYGNIPVFCVIGQRKLTWVEGADGTPKKHWVYPLRFSFDERVEDGLYCLAALKKLEVLLSSDELIKGPSAATGGT
jgi:hypothetical protein